MKQLQEYVDLMLYFASKETVSKENAIAHRNNAFGACEMFAVLNPEMSNKVYQQWNGQWRYTFDCIIRLKKE